MKVLWLMPPSKYEGEVPLVSQNRWFKYLPYRCNFIYPVIASYGVTMIKNAGHDIDFIDAPAEELDLKNTLHLASKADLVIMEGRTAIITWLWELAKEMKAYNPDLKVALYGDHVMFDPKRALIKALIT